MEVGRITQLTNVRNLTPQESSDVQHLLSFIRKYAHHTADCAIFDKKECDCGFFEERAKLPKGVYLTR